MLWRLGWALVQPRDLFLALAMELVSLASGPATQPLQKVGAFSHFVATFVTEVVARRLHIGDVHIFFVLGLLPVTNSAPLALLLGRDLGRSQLGLLLQTPMGNRFRRFSQSSG